MNHENFESSKSQENYLLETFSLVHRIVFYKLGARHRDSVEDVKQQIFLKLWRWKTKKSERELTEQEWRNLASVAAYNEVLDFFSSSHHRPMLFSQIDENIEELHLSILSTVSSQTPQSPDNPIETRSLLLLVWKAAQNLTLRQKYAFMLHNPDFIVDFIAAECSSMKELAEYFEVSLKEVSAFAGSDALPDKEIAEVLEKKLNQKVSPKSVWEARSKAKAKIAKRLAEFLNYGAASDQRRD